jgi:hypothetical protein
MARKSHSTTNVNFRRNLPFPIQIWDQTGTGNLDMARPLQTKATERVRTLLAGLRRLPVKLCLNEFLSTNPETLIAAVMLVSFIMPIVTFASPLKVAGISRAAEQLSRKIKGCKCRWHVAGRRRSITCRPAVKRCLNALANHCAPLIQKTLTDALAYSRRDDNYHRPRGDRRRRSKSRPFLVQLAR